MAEKALDIKVRAVDEATGVFGKIGQKVQEFRRAVNITEAKGGGLGEAAKSLADLGKIARVVGAVEVAAQGAKTVFTGIRGVTAYIKGDIEEAAKLLGEFKDEAKQIPFGVGTWFGVGNMLGELLFGDERDAKNIMAEVAKVEKQIEGLRKKQVEFTKAQGSIIDIGFQSQNQTKIEGLTGSAQQEEQVHQEITAKEKQILALHDLQQKAAQSDEQRMQAETDAIQAFTEIYRLEAAKLQKIRTDEVEDQKKKAQQAEAAAYNSNAEMIRLMEEDAKERADLAEKDRQQQEAAIKKQQEAARGEFRDNLAGALAPSVQSRFLTGVSQSARDRANDDAAKQLRQTNSILQMALEALRGIQSGIENQTLVGVAE